MILWVQCSGTEKQHVANDYAKRLHMGQAECTDLMGQAISKLAARDSATLDFQYCEYLNISVCAATQNGSVSDLVRCSNMMVHMFFLSLQVLHL